VVPHSDLLAQAATGSLSDAPGDNCELPRPRWFR